MVVALGVLAELALIVFVVAACYRYVRRRYDARWGVFSAGATGFAASQAVHLPLNALLAAAVTRPLSAHLGPSAQLSLRALVLGLSAGLCEELTRLVVLRYWKKSARGLGAGLAYGVGHGGLEALLTGFTALSTLLTVRFSSRVSPAAAARYFQTPFYDPLLAGAERVCAVTFHLCASLLVMLAVQRGVRWPLALAILWHATTDGVAYYLAQRFGRGVAEGFLGGTFFVSLALLAWCARELRAAGPAPKSGAR